MTTISQLCKVGCLFVVDKTAQAKGLKTIQLNIPQYKNKWDINAPTYIQFDHFHTP